LKKQSQFAPAQNGAKSYLKGDYDNKRVCGIAENKANQSQSKPISDAHSRLKDTSDRCSRGPSKVDGLFVAVSRMRFG